MSLKKIENYLKDNVKTYFFKIFDDSKFHNRIYNQNILTHIKIIIVSDDFLNKNYVLRHQMIFEHLKKINKKKIHSITLYTYTLNEWNIKKKIDFKSTKCIKIN